MGNTIWLALSVCAQKARTQYTYIPCVCCLWPLCNLFHNCFHVFVIQADKAVLCSGGAEKSRRYPCIFEAECSCENQLASWSSVTQQQLYVRVNTILQRGRGGGERLLHSSYFDLNFMLVWQRQRAREWERFLCVFPRVWTSMLKSLSRPASCMTFFLHRYNFHVWNKSKCACYHR